MYIKPGQLFITNVPNFWNKAKAIKSLVRSDHLAVLLKPVVKLETIRKTVEFRDLRKHNKLKMLREIDDFQRDTTISTIFLTKYGQYSKNVGNEPNRMSYSRLISPKITHFIYSLLS